MLERIVEKESLLRETIEKINARDIKVVIYGCGNSGQQIAAQIHDSSKILGFVVSDENHTSYPEGYRVSGIYELYNLKKLESWTERIWLLVSIAPTDFLEQQLATIKCIDKIYYLDGQQLLFPKMEYGYVREHINAIELLSDKLVDDYSRELLASYINTRISGNLAYMKKFSKNTREGIYFDKEIWQSREQEVLVDCGAYVGDSIEGFHEFTDGSYEKIYAFEPNEENLSILRKMQEKYHGIELIAKGCWNQRETLTFNSERGPMSEITADGAKKIEVDKIDHYLEQFRVTMIKMNIEGSEYNALLGAEETIKKNHPRLAISVYHKPEDLFTIPGLILGIDPGYRFKLQIYSYGSGLLVLFAE